jgi:hypothetical protein
MIASTTRTARSRAALKRPKNVDAFINFAEDVVARLTDDTTFPAPTPTLASVSAAIAELKVAQATALTRTRGAAVVLDRKRNVLVSVLHGLRIYVQGIADEDTGRSRAVIERAGMAIAKTVVRPPRVFAALAGAIPGTVKLVAPSAGHRARYDWQYSTDAETWNDLASTLRADTLVSGPPPGAELQLRYRSVLKTGETDWSAPIAFTVT